MASAVDSLAGQTASDVPPAKVPWARLCWIFALLVVCYAPVLKALISQWDHDPDMGHGFFVPAVAAYIAWQRRNLLLSGPLKPNYWGLAVLAYAAVQLVIGTLGAELFLQRTAFVFSIVGVTLTLGGWRALKVMGFPLFLLLFMVPIPAIIYNRITFPLQLFASRAAEVCLGVLGIPVLREGNVLELASQKLSVVEACSGIRSLLSLTFLSLVYGYLFDRKAWMRWALLAAVIPIAILANAGRVTVTGIISEWRTDLAQGFFHVLEGWIIFMVAMFLMLATHAFINIIYKARQHAKTTTV